MANIEEEWQNLKNRLPLTLRWILLVFNLTLISVSQHY